jgi:hypothetical protein
MRRKATATLLFSCLVVLICSRGFAAVNVTPSSFSVASGQATTITLQYNFAGIGLMTPFTGIITSTNGTFICPDAVIGTNPVPMSVSITNGGGIASEALVIPAGVVERALSRGFTNFIYRRNFSSPSGDTAVFQISITSDSVASFNVKRVELYFDNRRAEMTVQKYFPNLKAYADIRYTGSGLLEGYWEVDGRIITRVHKMLTFGAMTTLNTPDIPALPTFDPGSHIIRFVITNQGVGLPTPALIYFVTTEEFRARMMELAVKSPQAGSTIERKSAMFKWGSFSGASLFLIQYYENIEANPVFSAYTKKNSYILPEQVFTNIFSSGKKYYWKVTGYNDKDNVIGESATNSFTVK